MATTPINQKSRYTCRVEDCDVTDHTALIEYRAKRDEWLRWYEVTEGEPNSIQQQVFSMLFFDMTYRILAEARRGNGSATTEPQSPLLAHLLDQGYVATQVLAVRRLLDKRKDVVSVRRLLDDIADHKDLLTREIYVCYDGLPYDSEAWQQLPQTTEIKIWGIDAPGLGKYLGADKRHKTFDRLSGVLPSDRKRTDLIQLRIFDKLQQWLESAPAAKLITLSHKFFAHAADLASLGSLQYSGVILTEIADIHRAITRVERAITDEILFVAEAREIVPMPPLGLFKGLDASYVSQPSIDKMYERWKELSEERNNWRQGIGTDLYS
jgi:hypothetical protein